jgi:tRNA-splicing ligase RtcB
MKEKLKKLNDFEWLLPKGSRDRMNVDAKIIANDAVMGALEDDAITQLTNVACLPGVVEPVVGLPDMHWGYGLPMGAVSAFDSENGIISSGLCGFDINCGVNAIRTNLPADEVRKKLKPLIDALFKNIPCGVGARGRLKLTPDQLDEVLARGVGWAVANGYGTKDDIAMTEDRGCMEGADPSKVSQLAKQRGRDQLGTLGAGNHFLEIQKVSDIIDKKFASSLGIEKKDQTLIMLHCGSRGLGHQVATDYLKSQEEAVKKYKLWIPDRQLACAPANSKEGQDFFAAMKAATNYSFTNRLVMTHWIRETFQDVFKRSWEEMDMQTVYAICHNVIKLEEHKVGGKKRMLYVHRKGATRSFPNIPVLIAGTMGTASYILKGAEASLEKSFGSSCHGAGRAMSRGGAIKKFWGGKIKEDLLKKGIESRATNPQVLAEEAPLAYKDVEEVINSVHGAGISLKAVRMEPIGVLKG